MGVVDRIKSRIDRTTEQVASGLYEQAKRIPAIQRRIDQQLERMLKDLEESVKPYKGEVPSMLRLPEQPRPRAEILAEMSELAGREASSWQQGFASGAVYHGDSEHIDFLNAVYALSSQSNPLHADLWPSNTKYEAEIVSMTSGLLGADESETRGVCGTLSSGGTESILLAVKAYRDHARAHRKVTRPNIVVPTTAHAAFDKAADYFGIELLRIPVDDKYRAVVSEAAAAINRRTIALVGSAPSFPHGVIDPIPELSQLARARGCGFHTDACLGGFLLPWARELGYPVPAFDFNLPGVTSLSVDTHKYGYAAKGTSVILYRDPELRRFQYYTTADWPGGLYLTPTLAGSRPGALSAACWAAMLSIGSEGYRAAARQILETAAEIHTGIQAIPDLEVLGDPLWVIAFRSADLDIYRVLEQMSEKGWSLNGLHKPPCVHICVTLRHTQPGVAERFVRDLESAVAQVRETPSEKGRMAPVYGMAATIPARGAVNDMLARYLDMLLDP